MKPVCVPAILRAPPPLGGARQDAGGKLHRIEPNFGGQRPRRISVYGVSDCGGPPGA